MKKYVQINTFIIQNLNFLLTISSIPKRNWIIKPNLIKSYNIPIKSKHLIYKVLQILDHHTFILHIRIPLCNRLWTRSIRNNKLSRSNIISNSGFNIVNQVRLSQNLIIFPSFKLISQNLFNRLLSDLSLFFRNKPHKQSL